MANTQVLVLVDDQQVVTTINSSSFTLEDNWVEPIFFLSAVNNGGTTPTLDAVIQHSPNNEDWFTYDSFTQVTTGTSTQLQKPLITAAIHQPLGFIRMRAVLGGTDPDYNVTVSMHYRVEGAH